MGFSLLYYQITRTLVELELDRYGKKTHGLLSRARCYQEPLSTFCKLNRYSMDLNMLATQTN